MSEEIRHKEVRQLLEKILKEDPNFLNEVEFNWPKSCNSFCNGQTRGQRIREVIDYIFRQRLTEPFYEWLNKRWELIYQHHTD